MPLSDEGVHLLETLKGHKFGSGEAWEAVLVCALFFRIVLASLGEPVSTELGGIFPTIPTGCGLSVQYPTEEDWKTLKPKLVEDMADNSVKLVYPQSSNFKKYDMFIVVKTGTVSLWGYQCKAEELPSDSPEKDVKSIVLRSHDIEAGASKTSGAGWIVVGRRLRAKLLGPSFLILRGLEKPVHEGTKSSLESNQGEAGESKGKQCNINTGQGNRQQGNRQQGNINAEQGNRQQDNRKGIPQKRKREQVEAKEVLYKKEPRTGL
eukprot:TRINITY_DN7357_c0_g1_i1.p1 TRINITY_DN7357_c0_g1~~TRINITY_DN7357_c0_g1_i1.p1  ORF type:complete len:264 (-),score=36.19 TRINITY_DN7357_c0_g1_i1:267-1058(-)